MEYTNGKWYVSGSNPPRIYSHDGMSIIAECDSAGEMPKEREMANAHLISAAPDLLAALEIMEKEKTDYMLLNNLGNPAEESANIVARAAINKAKGL